MVSFSNWFQAGIKVIVGEAMLYILYSALIPAYEQAVSILVPYGLPQSAANTVGMYLVFGFIMLALALFIYIFLVAVQVEYDQYQPVQ